MNKLQNQIVFSTLFKKKKNLVALWAFLPTKMTDFPTLLYTSTSEITN